MMPRPQQARASHPCAVCRWLSRSARLVSICLAAAAAVKQLLHPSINLPSCRLGNQTGISQDVGRQAAAAAGQGLLCRYHSWNTVSIREAMLGTQPVAERSLRLQDTIDVLGYPTSAATPALLGEHLLLHSVPRSCLLAMPPACPDRMTRYTAVLRPSIRSVQLTSGFVQAPSRPLRLLWSPPTGRPMALSWAK